MVNASATAVSGKRKLVVLHGWGHDKSFWTDFVSRFRDGEVLVLELPGCGEEPLVSDTWGVPEYAAWVREKIAALQDHNIALMGHSFGGRVAGLVASERPPWLRGLILYAAPCLYRPKPSTRVKIAAAKALKHLGVKKILKGKYINEELKEADEVGLGAIFRKIIVFDETKALPKIAVPTLLIWGGKDTYPPLSMAREMQALISGSTLRIMEHEGHNAHLENPTFFYGIVKQFLGTL